MRIAFDIGGVLSKYPKQFHWLMTSLAVNMELFVITDMHDKNEVMKMLRENNVEVHESRVFCADYKTHGEMCKAILLKELQIDIFIDDFLAYTSWDSSFGPAPIRLLIAPDPFRPYWADEWKCEGADFGRRKFTTQLDQPATELN
jgi:hypothetical protein